MLSILLIIFGCSDDRESKQSDFDVVTSEKVLPEDFFDYKSYIVKKVVTQTEFEEVWKFYRFEKSLPMIDFENKDVIFIGLVESSNCPYEIEKENIAFNLNNQSIEFTLPKQYGACFLDAVPKTFVIKIGKDTSQDVKNVVIFKDEVETSIPFN